MHSTQWDRKTLNYLNKEKKKKKSFSFSVHNGILLEKSYIRIPSRNPTCSNGFDVLRSSTDDIKYSHVHV